jgi:hypothetical protein
MVGGTSLGLLILPVFTEFSTEFLEAQSISPLINFPSARQLTSKPFITFTNRKSCRSKLAQPREYITSPDPLILFYIVILRYRRNSKKVVKILCAVLDQPG